jgi:hypothetical protein
MTTTGLLSRGDVFIGLWQGGIRLPERYQVDAVKFTQKTNAELVSREGKGRSNWGQVIGSVTKLKPADISLSFNGITTELLAMVLLGSISALSMPGGAAVDEAVTLIKDTWIKVAHGNISEVSIAGSVEGVDFEVQPEVGLIKALPAGNIANNTLKQIGYTYGAITGRRISAGTKAQVDMSLEFSGEWIETGELSYLEIPRMTIMPKSDLVLLSDNKYDEMEFTGQPIKVAGYESSMIFDNNRVYA